MSDVALEVSLSDLPELNAALDSLAGLDPSELLDAMGTEVESQTRRRIESEKIGPDGEPWPDWSPGYARTRHGGHSLLSGEGHLADSIRMDRTGDEVEVGTGLVYGAIHQFGGEEVGMNIPPRPYLGLSADNKRDLASVVDGWIAQQVEGR